MYFSKPPTQKPQILHIDIILIIYLVIEESFTKLGKKNNSVLKFDKSNK